MNQRRIEMIRRQPDLASLEEIVMLAHHAAATATLRAAVARIEAEAQALLPAGGSGRGGALARIHEAAAGAMRATRPPITDADMADTTTEGA